MSQITTDHLTSTARPENQLMALISAWIFPLGYQVIQIEIQSHRQKTLRVYIDFLEPHKEKLIGIEDCVIVSRTIDELLDQSLEVGKLLSGHYELEVSSPGLNRPLRTIEDFQRFVGQDARIHVYRALTSEEMANGEYHTKNSKQKNFLGILAGVIEDQVVLSIPLKDKTSKGVRSTNLGKSPGKKNSELKTNSVEGMKIRIPLPLISKATLEPEFDFGGSDERE